MQLALNNDVFYVQGLIGESWESCVIGEEVDCRHRTGIRRGFASPDHTLVSLGMAFTSSWEAGQINKYIRPSSIIPGLP